MAWLIVLVGCDAFHVTLNNGFTNFRASEAALGWVLRFTATLLVAAQNLDPHKGLRGRGAHMPQWHGLASCSPSCDAFHVALKNRFANAPPRLPSGGYRGSLQRCWQHRKI